MKYKLNRKILYIFLTIIVVMVSSLTLVYAALSVTLNIQGNVGVVGSNWNIHFINPILNSKSVTKTIPSYTSDTVTFSTTLKVPGDFYEFTIDVVNDGTINAIIDKIEKIGGLTDTQAKYLDFVITYDSGELVETNYVLRTGTFARIKVRVSFKTDVSAADLPSTSVTINLGFKAYFLQTDSVTESNDKVFGDIQGGVNLSTYITALNKTFSGTPGKSLYNAINEKYAEIKALNNGNNYPQANEYEVYDSDWSNVFVDEDYKLLNLKNTIIEAGKNYVSTYMSYSANLSEEDLHAGNHVTVLTDASMSTSQTMFAWEGILPVFCNVNDTYLDVIHATFPGGYGLEDAATVAALEQEIINGVVVGFPAGQTVGCGTSTVHSFMAIADEEGNFYDVTTKVTHREEFIVYYYSISQDDMTFEEAVAFLQENL